MFNTERRKILVFILKVLGIIGATIVAHALATNKVTTGEIFEETHPFMAVILEIVALAIIFLS